MTIVPVLPLLLTVTERGAVPRAMLLVISVSPKAVDEPRTRDVGANPAVVAQVKAALGVAPTAKETTKREVVPAANPDWPAKDTVPAPTTDAAKALVKEAPPTSRTPTQRVIGLFVGMPTPSTARNWPPVTDVAPVYVLATAGFRIQRPPLTVTDVTVESTVLFVMRGTKMLSPKEVPPSVRVFAVEVKKARSPVLLKTKEALLFPVPAAADSLP